MNRFVYLSLGYLVKNDCDIGFKPYRPAVIEMRVIIASCALKQGGVLHFNTLNAACRTLW